MEDQQAVLLERMRRPLICHLIVMCLGCLLAIMHHNRSSSYPSFFSSPSSMFLFSYVYIYSFWFQLFYICRVEGADLVILGTQLLQFGFLLGYLELGSNAWIMI